MMTYPHVGIGHDKCERGRGVILDGCLAQLWEQHHGHQEGRDYVGSHCGFVAPGIHGRDKRSHEHGRVRQDDVEPVEGRLGTAAELLDALEGAEVKRPDLDG